MPEDYRQYGLARMEQRRIASGHWRIEGHTVRREPFGPLWHVEWLPNVRLASFHTLSECREFIYDRVQKGILN